MAFSRLPGCWGTRLRAWSSAAFVGIVLGCSFSRAETPATTGEQYLEGDVLVTFKAAFDWPSAQTALAAHGLAFARQFGFLSAQQGRLCGLIRAPGRMTAALIAELLLDPAVETAEPNYWRWVCGRVPNDPMFPQLWGLQNTGQAANGLTGTAGADVRFLPAWALAVNSTNQVVVAVVDTGVDYGHPDLAPNMWVNAKEIPANGLDDDGNGYVDDVYGYDFADSTGDPQDSGFHGTHVAGTIAAAGNNQLGVIGVDYQANIMALRVSSDGNSILTSAEIEALQYAALMATRGVNIVAINASFGGGGYNSTETAAIQAAGNAGIIFCAAAGNNTANNDSTPFYPASYRLPNMIVVAATDQNDALASFSDYGATTVDLAAPGVNILSAEPLSQGRAAYVQAGGSVFTANPLTYAGSTTITGLTAAVWDCGLGYPTNFPAGKSNYVALISRGTLTFAVKVANAATAGAGAAVISNNTNGNFLGTLGTAGTWIPALSISQADGQSLRALLPVIGKLVNALDPDYAYQYLDGTSMATPHVAGAVAFAAMNFPSETVAQRVQRVLANVHPVAGLGGLVRTGGRLDLQRIVDTDANGLPDWWEQMYFGHPTGTDPNADPDHDEANNLAEWLARTNPTNRASALRLAVVLDRTNGLTVAWPSALGRYYRLRGATNLANGFNVLVQTNVAATPPTNFLRGLPLISGGARFYRIELEP